MKWRKDDHGNEMDNALFLWCLQYGVSHRPWKEGEAGNDRWLHILYFNNSEIVVLFILK